MNLPRPTVIAVALGGLLCLVGSGAHADDDARHPERGDRGPEETIRSHLQTVAEHLEGALAGDEAARAALRDQALRRATWDDALDAWVDAANGAGSVEDVAIIGFDVDATLWFGPVPVARAEILFRITDEGFRVLRMRERRLERSALDGRRDPVWQGRPAVDFGALTRGVLLDAVSGPCDELPLVDPAVPDALPEDEDAAQRARETLGRLAEESRRTCRSLDGLGFHRITWELGRLAGTLVFEDGRQVAFEQPVIPGPDGRIRLDALPRPRL